MARDILTAGAYQEELPGDGADGVLGGDRSTGGGGRGSGARDRYRPEGDAEGSHARRGSGGLWLRAGNGAGLLLWIVLAVFSIGALVWVFSRARGHSDIEVTGAPAKVALPRPPVQWSPGALHDAELHAREGKYGEAIRLLLGLTFESLSQRVGLQVEPWLTSREIAARAELPAPALASVHALVDAVERSLFAGREPDLQDWQACAREYEALTRSGEAS